MTHIYLTFTHDQFTNSHITCRFSKPHGKLDVSLQTERMISLHMSSEGYVDADSLTADEGLFGDDHSQVIKNVIEYNIEDL